MIARLLQGLIRCYQLFISPLTGPSCRFVPTCSQYAIDAIGHYGPLKGSLMALWRLARCHPFHPGGYDPVIKPSEARPPVRHAVNRNGAF